MTTATKTLLDTTTLHHSTLSVIIRIYSLADESFEITEEWSNDGRGEQTASCGARGAGPEYFWAAFADRVKGNQEYLDSLEEEPRLHCASCGQGIWVDVFGQTDKTIGRLTRGSFSLGKDHEDPEASKDYIKFERHICSSCWLTDPDLCRFFNRIGCRVR